MILDVEVWGGCSTWEKCLSVWSGVEYDVGGWTDGIHRL